MRKLDEARETLQSSQTLQENIRECFRGAEPRLLRDSATLHFVRFTLRMDIIRLTLVHMYMLL